MDYAPFQAWITENVIRTPTAARRPTSQLTDYDPVYTGNVIPGQVDIPDPGMLGSASLPSLHTSRNLKDRHLDPDISAVDTLTSLIPRTARWVGLRGGTYNPFTFTDIDDKVTDYVAQSAVGQMPFGPQGATAFEGDTYEHGPISIDELEVGRNVRQPRKLRQRSWFRTLFFLPAKDLDPTGTTDERVIRQAGEENKDTPRLTDASVGTGIAFSIPDVRRTFDQPKDAPPGVPRDMSGNPLYRKAGYQLINTALEPIPHDIQTSHAYPGYSDQTELAIGDSRNRVRAGVQYDWQATRPSVMPHWFDFRGFDQLIAQHPLGIKGQVKPPSISRPIMTNDDPQANQRWAAGRRYSAPPAGMSALGVHPNIDRQAPQAWDTGLYLDDPGTMDTRAAAWRLNV